MRKNTEKIFIFSMITGFIVIFLSTYPIISTLFWTKPSVLLETLHDKQVLDAICLSLLSATLTTLIAFILGVPFAYLLARKNFKGKELIESIIDIPIVIPHTVAGICLLSAISPRFYLGKLLEKLGIEFMGTLAGIVLAMTFVSMPLLINAAKEAFRWVPERLENVSRTLGASHTKTFFLVTFRLAWRDILSGMIMTWARAISEFGAVIILAYHPMIAPTLIYERFTTYGMMYAVPVTTILIFFCLLIFIFIRVISLSGGKQYD